MTLHGIDISNYQAGIKLADTDAQFVIVKSTEGTGFVDKYCNGFIGQAKQLGLPFGVYHFFKGSGVAEAKFFLDNVGGYIGEGVLVLDWENGAGAHAEALKFLDYVKDQTKITPWVYTVKSYLSSAGAIQNAGYPLWIAYPSSADSYGSVAPWPKAIAWQYSWEHHTGGYAVDADRFYGSKADWQAMAAGDAHDTSSDTADDGGTATVHEDIWPTQGSIQTPYGQKGSSWQSGYHQGDDWHRNAGQDEVGDPIVAVASGTIIYAGDARNTGAGWGSAFGIHVLNQWDSHGRTSIDAHMSKLHVKTGDRVKAGDLIGEKGATGNVSGPHDHHEQHTGTHWTDPDVKPIYPGRTITKTGDEIDMAEHVTKVRTKEQGVEKIDTDEWLWIDDDNGTSLITYPAKVIGGIIDITISGLEPGEYFQIYPCAVDVKDDSFKIVSSDAKHPMKFPGQPKGDWVRDRKPFDWVLGDQEKGYKFRGLRFRVRGTSLKAKIEHLNISGWVVKS